MKNLKKRKFFGFAFFLSIIFALNILNFNNLNTTNSLLQLNGENSSNVLIDNAEKVDVLPNGSGDFFILSKNNTSTKISFLDRNCIESNNSVTSTQIDFKYLDAKVVNNDIYLLVLNDANKKQIIKTSVSGEQNVYFNFKDESLVNSFCISDNTLFFIENNTVFGFVKNESSEAVNLLSGINSIFLNYTCDYLYIVKEDKSIMTCSISDLKTAITNSPDSIQFNNLTLNGNIDLKNDPINFLNNDLFMSSTKGLFKVNIDQGVPKEIANVFTQDVSEISVLNCVSILNFESKDYLFCKTKENKATLFDIVDNFSRKYSISFKEDETILSICSSGDNTLLIYKDAENKYFAKLIDKGDLVEETDPANSSDDPSNPQNPNGNESDKLFENYKTDSENKYILDVELGTTVAVFKQNLSLNEEYTVSFKNYAGKEITSGKLGTGSVVSFWKDGKIVKEYTLVVKFDVTGEGNFNSRDIDYMYNEIFKNGKTSLSGPYFYSGDVDKNGIIDTRDLLMMIKKSN